MGQEFQAKQGKAPEKKYPVTQYRVPKDVVVKKTPD